MARTEALGLVETFGIVFVIENTASGYISVLVEGDVGACKTAVAAGVKAVQEMGTEPYSSVVIARPHEDLQKITRLYKLENLLPYSD